MAWLLAWLLGTAAHAQATAPVDEIIVYGDDFARWDDTRWLVEAELMIPLGVFLAKDNNYGFQSYAFQIRSILNCGKDYEPKKRGRVRRLDVTCQLEDIALLATAQRRWKREKDRELVQSVLDEIDAKLTGTEVQLQVDFKGGVNNVDIEGITARNERQRRLQETLRQIVMRTLAGYHLKIPEHAQRSGQWVEYNSELMEVPSLTSSRGSTTLVHQVSPYGKYQLIQTVGEGGVSVKVPVPRTESPREVDDGAAASTSGGGGIGGGARTAGAAPPPQGQRTAPTEVELTYQLGATGVTLFERDTGVMTERVWAVEGHPTASSAGGANINTIPFRNVGRLRILSEGENPDLGPTKQVAPPGQAIAGLDPWTPLQVIEDGDDG